MNKVVEYVEIWQQECSTPHIRENVECYTKGRMYCVFNREKNITEKFPMCSVFKVVESYN